MNEQSFYSQLNEFIDSPIFNLLIIALLLYVLKRFGMLVLSRAVRRGIQPDAYATETAERKREDTIISIIDVVFKVAMWVFGAMLILAQLGVDIGPLIAGVSFAGVAIGFGAQSMVKDFVSGIFIILENQYRVGDVISVAGVTGTVEAITIRQTILRDLDGHQHHVPNGIIDVATNMSMEFANVHMNIGVSYDSDIDKVTEVINETGKALAEHKDYKELITEAPAFVRVDNFGASEVGVKVIGRVKPGSQWKVAGEFRKQLKIAFDKNKIEIPFPQIVTHKGKYTRLIPNKNDL